MQKKTAARFLALMLAVSMLPVQPVYATTSSEIHQQKEEKEKEKANTQKELDYINTQIGDLSGEKEKSKERKRSYTPKPKSKLSTVP